MQSCAVTRHSADMCWSIQVGAIVPWNYPFHNIFNPLSAAVYSGNAIVIKVTHHSQQQNCTSVTLCTHLAHANGAVLQKCSLIVGCSIRGEILACFAKAAFAGVCCDIALTLLNLHRCQSMLLGLPCTMAASSKLPYNLLVSHTLCTAFRLPAAVASFVRGKVPEYSNHPIACI